MTTQEFNIVSSKTEVDAITIIVSDNERDKRSVSIAEIEIGVWLCFTNNDKITEIAILKEAAAALFELLSGVIDGSSQNVGVWRWVSRWQK